MQMVGTLWHLGVSIEPARLLDDEDHAYTVFVLGCYDRMMKLRQKEADEQAQQSNAP